MSHNIYRMITERILEKLEEGVIPWNKPFQSGVTVNWTTQKPYREINTMLLAPGEYAMFNQIKKAGGKVKKGASPFPKLQLSSSLTVIETIKSLELIWQYFSKSFAKRS